MPVGVGILQTVLRPFPCAGHAAGILLFVVVLGCFCRVAAVAFSLRMSPRWFC